jgi:hypothetical protein
MGKNFSQEYPFSKFSSVQFNININREKTAITKSYFGFWEEKVYARYSEEAHELKRFNYAKQIMNLAKKFSQESELVEVVALNWYGFNKI